MSALFPLSLSRLAGCFAHAARALRYDAGNVIGKLAIVAALTMPLPAGAADRLQIVALGDSLTQGYGLPQDEGFVPQLQAWLDAKGAEVTVVNAGVSGDTTAGGLQRLDWSLTPDTDALIVALGGNDLLRGLPYDASRANLERILGAAGERGLPVLLIGQTAPGNYGADYKAKFDAMWPALAQEHHTLLVTDFLGPLTVMDSDARVAAGVMQPDNLHPSAKGVTLVVEHIGPAVLELAEQARAKP
ncbi:arylesterase [Haematobacter missouriensis]|uniref:Arylesterase n=2 Tax=Haematobacter missouriensis TaxID=366616 RepID=A0A212AQ90_9RHOB|nr:arylesterase [Haematobacter missouriensis]OWJ83658.1 arylesterase [Haematobacter missouriensis]